MGQIVSRVLVALGLIAPIEPSFDEVRRTALDKMRRVQQQLTDATDHKRRLVRDIDEHIVVLGLRARNAANRLSELDAAEFRRHFRRRKMMVRSHSIFQQQLSNLDEQVERLATSPVLELSLDATKAGVDARHRDATRVRATLVELNAQLATLNDDERIDRETAAIREEVTSLDDAALEHELDDLMHNDDFIGQFEAEWLERRRIELLHLAPSVPDDEPSVAVRGAARQGAAVQGAAVQGAARTAVAVASSTTAHSSHALERQLGL